MDVSSAKPSVYRMSSFFLKERESKGGKKVPRKKDNVLPFTFAKTPIEGIDEQVSDETTSASENDELEVLSNIEVTHDHQYSTSSVYRVSQKYVSKSNRS